MPAVAYKGAPINESLVINEWLEDAYPNAKPLLPKDPVERAHARLGVDLTTKEIIPAYFRLLQAQEPAKQDDARKELYAALKKFEAKLRGDFYMGRELTHADIALIPFVCRFYILEEHRKFDVKEVGTKFAGVFTYLFF